MANSCKSPDWQGKSLSNPQEAGLSDNKLAMHQPIGQGFISTRSIRKCIQEMGRICREWIFNHENAQPGSAAGLPHDLAVGAVLVVSRDVRGRVKTAGGHGRLPIDQLRQVAITVVTGDEFTNRVSRVIGILDRGQAANPADPFE
jgi:hypothetical protein